MGKQVALIALTPYLCALTKMSVSSDSGDPAQTKVTSLQEKSVLEFCIETVSHNCLPVS